MATDEPYYLDPELAEFSCSTGPFAVPILTVAAAVTLAHEEAREKDAPVREYLAAVARIVCFHAGVVLNLDEVMAFEERLWTLAMLRVRQRTLYLRNLAAALGGPALTLAELRGAPGPARPHPSMN